MSSFCLHVRKPRGTRIILWSITAVSTLNHSHMVFIDPGVKIIGVYYRDVLLAQHLLPVIRNLALEGYFIFQQDSAPANRSGGTIEMPRRNTPELIPPTLWPPDSPDLNPVDHKVWSVMQEQVYHTPIHDANHLKQRLLDVWEEWSQDRWRPKCERPSVEAATDTITDLLKFVRVHNSLLKHSYLFIYCIKCYGVLETYCWLNSLNIVLVWYDQA